MGKSELLSSKFQNIHNKIPKASGTNNELNEGGFTQLYKAIEALFESNDNEARRSESLKVDLLRYVYNMNSNRDQMTCGTESIDNEIQKVLELVAALESEPSNIIVSSGGDILQKNTVGGWKLLYTTLVTIKFNKDLSRIVPPGDKFGELRYKLPLTKYLVDVDFF